jgi:hypothetical protein
MSEAKTIFSINAFPGNKAHGLAWPAMKRHLIDVARSCFSNTQDNLGVVAYLVNEAKYSEIYFMYHGHAPPPEDDQLPQSSSSSQGAVAIGPKIHKYTKPKMPVQANFDLKEKKERENYQFQTKNWQDESNAVQSFRSKLLAALDEVALSAIGTDDERVTMKLEDIYEALDLRFSTVSASELKRELKKNQRANRHDF